MRLTLFQNSVLLLLTAPGLWAAGNRGEWPVFGGDAASTKYSALAEINTKNVNELQPVWEWRTGEEPLLQYGTAPGRFEATPLMIDDVLYLPTPYNRVVALDANTGKELWSYDPHAYELGAGPPSVTFADHRGIAIWSDGKERRIFLPTRGRLIALDAKTGKRIATFGNEGEVDLTKSLAWEIKDRRHYNNTSPPVIYQNLVIVGSNIPDTEVYRKSPPGDVQAFDVRTGKRVWIFHTVPQKGEFGTDTWVNDSWRFTGHANVWVPFTLDEKRGLLYLPVSTPANDHYGGERKGGNLFADSLVCVDAATGKRRWHFQTVHHGLWDYDGVTTPTLLTIRVRGKEIDAVAAPSKTGFVYVFDRVTGEPVWPIEERPVPQSDVPGEKTSPTQPFPTKPPPFAKQGFTLEDVVDFTPEIRAMAMEKLKPYRFGPIFTPPSLQGTVIMPSVGGGANWGSGAADPQMGILYVKAANNLKIIQLMKPVPGTAKPEVSGGPYWYTLPAHLDQTIAGGIPLNKPPYGVLTAIDLNKGELLWQVPVGDLPAIHDHPLLKDLHLPPMGGVGNEGMVVTAGGVILVGVGNTKLYAVDKDNGQVLWAGHLKFPTSGSPVTYRTRSGRQFVVVATGSGKNATLVAFALRANTSPEVTTATPPSSVSQTISTVNHPSEVRDWTVFMPDEPTKALVVKDCFSCHDIERVVKLRGNHDFWTDLIWNMVSNGADISREDVERMAKYLSVHLGPNQAPLVLPININTANRGILGLLAPIASHADEIIRAREHGTQFTSIEDLLKVPGITTEDIEKIKPFISTQQ